MNCNEFETLVNDLARKPVIDATVGAATNAHAKECARCNARLAEEKQLTVGLRALAILDENKRAPEAIEASLLTAFRKAGGAAKAVPSPTVLPSLTGGHSRRWWLAAAAVILALFAVAVLRMQTATEQPQADPTQIVHQPTPQEPTPDQEKKSVVPERPMPQQGLVPERRPNRKSPSRVPRKEVQRLNPQVATVATTGSAPVGGNLTSREQPAQGEVTTPFISLTQGYTLPMSEGGQVLRVEMPRAVMASFGLPVNEDRLNGRVKADVVVGYDGIPRAIRFVR